MDELLHRCRFLCSRRNPTPCLTMHEQACFCGTSGAVLILCSIAFTGWLLSTVVMPLLGLLYVTVAPPVAHCNGTVAAVLHTCVYDSNHCTCLAEGAIMFAILVAVTIIVFFAIFCTRRLCRACHSFDEMAAMQPEATDVTTVLIQ